MDGSDVVAAIALAVSTGSAVAAGVSLLFGFREQSRRNEEIRWLREESGRREEELALLRQQFGEEQNERRRLQQAGIVAEAGGRSGLPNAIEYEVIVSNGGPAPALQVGVQLEDADGVRVGSPATARVPRPLMPGDTESVLIRAPGGDWFQGPYVVYVEWFDGRGYNEEETDVSLGPVDWIGAAYLRARRLTSRGSAGSASHSSGPAET